MTDFVINNEIYAKGEMTIQQELLNNNIVIKGIMELDTYIEDIKIIETRMFYVAGVQVTKETFGTNDKKIVYEFIATGFGIDGDLFNSEREEE